jgi:alkylhydroperoxidase family enzyme
MISAADTTHSHRETPRVAQLDLAHASPEALAAASAHERRASLTNMKRTLLHAVPAFDALMTWYTLRDAIAPVIGDRAILIYCFAVSERADCLICSTFFRRLLIDRGEDPKALVLSAHEEALASFGRQLATPPFTVDDDTWSVVTAGLTDEQIVTLVSFGAIMLATNVFNNALGVPLDDYLRPYLAAERIRTGATINE